MLAWPLPVTPSRPAVATPSHGPEERCGPVVFSEEHLAVMVRPKHSDTPFRAPSADRSMRVSQGHWEGMPALDLGSGAGASRTLPALVSPRKPRRLALCWSRVTRLSNRGELHSLPPELWGDVSPLSPTP